MLSGEHSTTFKAPWAQNGAVLPLPLFLAVSEGVWECREAPLLCPLAWVSSLLGTLGLAVPQVPVPALQL